MARYIEGYNELGPRIELNPTVTNKKLPRLASEQEAA